MIEDITVLITAAGNVFMPGTTACLKENGERNIKLIGADMNEDPTILQMCDVYYVVPRGDDPSYIDCLLEICRKEKVDVVLPIMSSELNQLSKNKNRFEKIGTKVSVSSLDALDIANDKLKLLNYLKDSNMPCANFYIINSIDDLEKACHNLGYPEKKVCIKAIQGSGSRGFRIISSTDSKYETFIHEKPISSYVTLKEMKEILSEANELPKFIAMEYLDGDEYTVDLLADNGNVLYCCCRKSIRMENSIMLDGVIVDEKSINDLCKNVVEKLGLDGNIGFDLKNRKDGNTFILECNPRITAGIAAFNAAGVNLPYLNVKRLLGEELPIVNLEVGKMVRRRWQEMYC